MLVHSWKSYLIVLLLNTPKSAGQDSIQSVVCSVAPFL